MGREGLSSPPNTEAKAVKGQPNQFKLLLLAVGLVWGCVPTAQALRSRTSLPRLDGSQPGPQLREESAPFQKTPLFGEVGLTLENAPLTAKSRTRSLAAFGTLVSKSGPVAEANSMQFSSVPRHLNSGLSLYPSRALNPGLQRWLSRDPIGETGGINLYEFVRNDPSSYVDPYGEDFRVVGASGLLTPGPLGYLSGDTTLEQVAAAGYNVVPEVGNILANAGQGLMTILSGLDQATGEVLTRLTGNQQLGQGLNNLLAVTPIGWPEDLAKMGRLAETVHKAARFANKPRCFKNFEALKRAYPNTPGMVWHHIVEQRAANIDRFGAEAIHNMGNVVEVSPDLNSALNAFYSSKNFLVTGSQELTVRQWLTGQSLEQQAAFGLRAVQNVASGVWK